MPPVFTRRAEDAARAPRSHLLRVLLQLLQIILAVETSWAISPRVDELEEGSGGRGEVDLGGGVALM